MSYQLTLDTTSPAERRRKRIRQLIVDAAERVFAREGEAGLSIRRLAEEVDYSPAAIYKYFASKQDLIDELKEVFFARLLTEIDEAGPVEAEDYLSKAHDRIMIYMRIALEKPHHYAAAFVGEVDETVPISRLDDDSNKAQAFMRLHKLVEQGVRLGVFRPDLNILHAAKSVWAATHGFVKLKMHLPQLEASFECEQPLSEEAFMSQHVDFILRGLSK